MSFDPRELLKLRLKNEYAKVQAVFQNNEVYVILPAPGEELPYVQKYWVTYKIPTFIDYGKRLQSQIKIEIDIPDSFPVGSPRAHVIEGKVPFHVHIWENGYIDNGGFWNHDKWIYDYIIFLGKTLSYNAKYVNVNSPSNMKAVQFFNENRDKFPTIAEELLEVQADNSEYEDSPNEEKSLVVDIVLSSGKRISLEAEAGTYAYEITDHLLENGILEPVSGRGYYVLRFKEKNQRILDRDATLEVNGVCEYDTLEVYPYSIGD